MRQFKENTPFFRDKDSYYVPVTPDEVDAWRDSLKRLRENQIPSIAATARGRHQITVTLVPEGSALHSQMKKTKRYHVALTLDEIDAVREGLKHLPEHQMPTVFLTAEGATEVVVTFVLAGSPNHQQLEWSDLGEAATNN